MNVFNKCQSAAVLPASIVSPWSSVQRRYWKNTNANPSPPNNSTWESLELSVNEWQVSRRECVCVCERERHKENKETVRQEICMCVQRLIVCMCDPGGHGVWLTITFVLCVCVPSTKTKCYLNWSIWDPDPTRLPSPAQVFYECDLFPNREIQMKMRQGPQTVSGEMETEEKEKGQRREGGKRWWMEKEADLCLLERKANSLCCLVAIAQHTMM